MKKKQIKETLVFISLVLLLVSGLLIPAVQADASNNRIHFINTKGVSGSDAIILESNGHYALIDMGEDYDFPDGEDPRYPSRVGISRQNDYVLEDRLFRHMKHLGIQKLDFILGTHVHSDHIGSADEVLKRYPVDRFYLKRYSDERITSKWRLWDNLFNYDNAVKTALERGVTLVQDITEKESHFTLGDMDIQLYNYKNEYDSDGKLKRVYDDNSNSIVAVVTVAGKKIYLGGDLDNAEGAEDKLGPEIGKVDMMKWNHHYDAHISNTIPFLDSLSPSMVVHTSAADANLATTRDYLKKHGIEVVHASSQTKDATVFTISRNGFTNVSDSLPNIPTVSERWYKEDGYWKYRLSDDQMAIGWRKINGIYYFFNGQGQMQAGRWLHLNDSREKPDGNWYYLNNNGQMQDTGWFKHDGTWYYIASSGARSYSQLVEIDGQKYLFDKDGKMLTGLQVYNGKKMVFASSGALQSEGKASSWQKIASNWYYYDEDGILTVGKKDIKGTTYYFDKEGIMQTGWALVDGKWYYFANSGAMQTGWQWQDKGWQYYTSSGAMKTDWLKSGESWYYLDPETGIMAVGSQEINGKNYFFKSSGIMQVGWQWVNDSWHYYTSTGALQTGWLKDGGTWYYLDAKEGTMLIGLHAVNGEQYYFSTSGAMQTGWKWIDGQYRYFQASGAMKTGWIKDQGKWYYLEKETGIMLVGLHKVNGQTYYFGPNGAIQTGWKQLDGNWYYFQTDGALLKNATTPDGYKVNEEGIWKQAVAAVNSEAVKPEQKQEANSNLVEQEKQDSKVEANASDKKE